MKSEEVLKALSDRTRLDILSIISKKPSFAEEISLQLNTTQSTVSFHLKKLENAGIIVARKEQYYRIYSLNEPVLKLTIGELLSENEVKNTDVFERLTEKECFKNGRVEKLPVQTQKRLAIFKIIAGGFKPNKEYSLREANIVISEKCDDFVAAREGMVEAGFLVKSGDKYRLKKDKGK